MRCNSDCMLTVSSVRLLSSCKNESDYVPAQTALPEHMHGNRAPSSLVQSMIAIGLLVISPFSCNVRITSRPESTPRIPSKRPPRGWVSRCDPIAIGAVVAKVLSEPTHMAKILPAVSILISEHERA